MRNASANSSTEGARTGRKETNSCWIIHDRSIVDCFFLPSCLFRHGTTILPGNRVRCVCHGLPWFVLQPFTTLVLRFHRFPTVSILRHAPPIDFWFTTTVVLAIVLPRIRQASYFPLASPSIFIVSLFLFFPRHEQLPFLMVTQPGGRWLKPRIDNALSLC